MNVSCRSHPDLAAAPVFAIRKSWVDTEAGIGMVQIQYAWTPLSEQPRLGSGRGDHTSPST